MFHDLELSPIIKALEFPSFFYNGLSFICSAIIQLMKAAITNTTRFAPRFAPPVCCILGIGHVNKGHQMGLQWKRNVII